MDMVKYYDGIVNDTVKLINQKPGWDLKRIAAHLNVDHKTLYRQFFKRGHRVIHIRKPFKAGQWRGHRKYE